MGGFGSVFLLYTLILIYFFKYEIIIITSAWSFVIQIPIQAVCPVQNYWVFSNFIFKDFL